MSSTTRRQYLYWALYIVFLAVLAEGSARLAFRVPALNERLSQPDNLGWRRSWVTRHRSGKAMYFSFDTFDTSKGWRTRANIRNQKVFDGKILNTNADGFRGTRDFPLAKDSTKTRILLLGDSFTFGESVSDEETYAAVLQRLLPNAEVMNAGMHGYAHDQMLVMLREQLRYHPDVVMLGYLPGDIPRNLISFRDYAKPSYTLDSSGLHLHGIPVPPPEATLRFDWARPRVIDLASAIRYRLEPESKRATQAEALTTAILAELVRVADSIHAKPVFVYLPNAKELRARTDSTHEEIWFAQLCRKLATVHCISPWPAFREQIAKGVRFKQVGHWDALGHRLTAETIARFLVDSGFVRP